MVIETIVPIRAMKAITEKKKPLNMGFRLLNEIFMPAQRLAPTQVASGAGRPQGVAAAQRRILGAAESGRRESGALGLSSLANSIYIS